MITHNGRYIQCDHLGCKRKIKNYRWARIKASNTWFHSQDGQSFCPDHLPKWVAEWREARRNS